MKSFKDTSHYEADIRMVVPGYDSMHSLLPSVLVAQLELQPAKILVVGCGPGQELLALASSCDEWVIEAIDASAEMAQRAMEVVASQGLSERIKVFHRPLSEHSLVGQYDACVCLLVSHFFSDDGGRKDFLECLSKSLRPGGVLLLGEMTHQEELAVLHNKALRHWSKSMGASPDRLALMELRMAQFFHLLPLRRTEELFLEVGLESRGSFFQALSLVGTVSTKSL